MSKLMGLNWEISPAYLQATVMVSLLSVLVLVFLFFYLNHYTGRRYFRIWTLGWTFYAFWLGLGPSLDGASPFQIMIKHWCLGLSAAMLFWGSVQFLKLPSRPLLFCLFMGFLLAWSYVGAYYLKNPLQIRAPIFSIIGLASLVTSYSFYRLRKHREYIGAGLLTFGFMLWGVYLGICPFYALDRQMAGTGSLISAVLQLFIAVSMIILVLEEARAANEMILAQIRAHHLEAQELKAGATGEDAPYQGVFDRSTLSEQLRQAQEDLRQAQEQSLQRERLQALAQMSRGIAHDINNALTPILGYTNLLLRDGVGLPSTALNHIRSIKMAGEKISQSVQCIRDFYRKHDHRSLALALEPNGPAREVFEQAQARWQESPQAGFSRVAFNSDFQPALPLIMGTNAELQEAINQLIQNAVESIGKSGTVTLRTYLRTQAPDLPGAPAAGKVVLEVSDTGVGMDEETRKKCLEPFFSTKNEHGAKGLGLSRVFGIVQRHQGEIEIESRLGKGTVARLLFPAVPSGNTEQFAASPNAPALPRLKILCIDDEPSILDVLKIALKSGGHDVEAAGDGQSGLDVFRAARASNQPFDVVLTDLGMPRMDGHRVAKAIKEESLKTPVIMLTGWGGIMHAEVNHPENVDIILSKPPQVNELIGALRKVTSE